MNISVVNVHERVLDASVSEIGALIDRLASDADALWPHARWPAMKFDRPLGVGAVGGHGPVRYAVESYEPGCSIRFRFAGPKGFLGGHRFEIEEIGSDRVRLRHIIEMRAVGLARLTWPLIYQPLHDALIGDALDRAEIYIGGRPTERGWSLWVRVLRWAMNRARSVQQRL